MMYEPLDEPQLSDQMEGVREEAYNLGYDAGISDGLSDGRSEFIKVNWCLVHDSRWRIEVGGLPNARYVPMGDYCVWAYEHKAMDSCKLEDVGRYFIKAPTP